MIDLLRDNQNQKLVLIFLFITLASSKSRDFSCNIGYKGKVMRDIDNIENRNYMERDAASLDSTYPRSTERWQ